MPLAYYRISLSSSLKNIRFHLYVDSNEPNELNKIEIESQTESRLTIAGRAGGSGIEQKRKNT